MSIAALVAWLVTAVGGFYMLGTWTARGGASREGSSRLPVPVIFGHFLLAATGLVVWVVYLFADTSALAWTAFAILLPVALLGFVMFARGLAVTRSPAVRTTQGAPGAATPDTPAEHAFPVPVVLGHGLFAVATLILVLLAALQA
ncbi:hypothetical protein [Actinomadura livida]|uniref:Putative membrane protein n=1 Tax=Actinomadura livida TaxID=79909 RepID=A0A7W7N0C4_9ACTN|nr:MULTISPECIES: hypothetical protein [Actinomadura]MBB4777743.1 putative membrane protein [Actinomadura catellatispora]GGT99044.1 hypothetical protein GCM10010208_23280 [Actinomadura livida]